MNKKIIENLILEINKHLNKLPDISFLQALKTKNSLLFGIFLNSVPKKYVPSCFYENSVNIPDDFLHLIKCLSGFSPDEMEIVYQTIINFPLIKKGSKFLLLQNKTVRDELGSYYTPSLFSKKVIEKAVSYHSLNFNDKVIDFSCGSGIFLASYADEIINKFGSNQSILDSLCKNIYAVDVDPVALLIASYRVGTIIGNPIKNVFFGNPLILKENATIGEKMQAAFEGRYYSQTMGFSTSFFDLKYDVVIGNPPWEKIRFEERKFFTRCLPSISEESNKTKRSVLIEELKKKDFELYSYYQSFKNDYSFFKNTINKHPLLSLSLAGELNCYALFFELSNISLAKNGLSALIVKSSLVRTSSKTELIKSISNKKQLACIASFDNSKKIFPIDSREEFAVLIFGSKTYEKIEILLNCKIISDLTNKEGQKYTANQLLAATNEIGILPKVASFEELDRLIFLQSKHVSFSCVFKNVKFGRLVHLTNHSNYIFTEKRDNNIPIYEGKFIGRYDLRFASFEHVPMSNRYSNKASAKQIPNSNSGIKAYPVSRYFIDEYFWKKLSKTYKKYNWMLAWRSLSSPTNKEIMISCILPFCPTSQSIQFLCSNNVDELLIINGLFNSDYFCDLLKKRMPGLDLTQTLIKSIPVPDFEIESTKNDYEEIISNVLYLYSNEPLLERILKESEFTPANNKTFDEAINKINKAVIRLYSISEKR